MEYKPCSDKPVRETRNVYYPDGISLKEHYEATDNNYTDTYYSKDGRKTKEIAPGDYHHKIIEIDYEYRQ